MTFNRTGSHSQPAAQQRGTLEINTPISLLPSWDLLLVPPIGRNQLEPEDKGAQWDSSKKLSLPGICRGSDTESGAKN